MKTKTLEKLMTFTEAKDYVFTHPDYRLPTKKEAYEMDNWFPHWIDTEPYEDDNALVVETNLLDNNILFKNRVILVKVPTAVKIPITNTLLNKIRKVLILNETLHITIEGRMYEFIANYEEE